MLLAPDLTGGGCTCRKLITMTGLSAREHNLLSSGHEHASTGRVKSIRTTRRGRPAPGSSLDDYIAAQQKRIRRAAHNHAAGVTRAVLRLAELLLCASTRRHFENSVQARIGWGRQHQQRAGEKSIRLGVYDHKAREIRIHPALEFGLTCRASRGVIVFPKLCAPALPSDSPTTGRHVHHPRRFGDRERAFPKYAAAMAWERQHLQELLRR